MNLERSVTKGYKLKILQNVHTHISILFFQSKFPDSMKHEGGWNPPHGIRLECACIVILNALGYIGFKVISTSGDHHEYVWTMERNLDMDTQYQAKLQEYNN